MGITDVVITDVVITDIVVTDRVITDVVITDVVFAAVLSITDRGYRQASLLYAASVLPDSDAVLANRSSLARKHTYQIC